VVVDVQIVCVNTEESDLCDRRRVSGERTRRAGLGQRKAVYAVKCTIFWVDPREQSVNCSTQRRVRHHRLQPTSAIRLETEGKTKIDVQ